MAQQTAMQKLLTNLESIGITIPLGVQMVYLKIEKEQIIKAHGDKGWAKPIIDDNGIPKKDGIAFGTTTGEQYYKETYNNTPS